QHGHRIAQPGAAAATGRRARGRRHLGGAQARVLPGLPATRAATGRRRQGPADRLWRRCRPGLHERPADLRRLREPGSIVRLIRRRMETMSVALGMPALPPPVLAPRRKSRKVSVGKVDVGGDAPVSVQSMTTTPTTDINATLQQIAELTAAGCDIVRVAVPSADDAEALPAIAKKSQIPVIADIHFQPKYVFAAIDAGCAAVRVNPGNIKK